LTAARSEDGKNSHSFQVTLYFGIFTPPKHSTMGFYNIIIKYRFWLSLLAVAIGLGLELTGVAGFWPVFPLYFLGLIGILSHFFIGPLRLVQAPMEAGDMDEVERILATIWWPQLLYKPVRSTYYTIKGNLAMVKQDFDTAEKHLKKSSDLGSAMPEAEGANKLQLGMMAMQKGDIKQGEAYIRAAIRAGIPDKESEAVAFLSMCQIFMNKREFRAAKDYFRKAKACKPTTKQVVDQIKEIEKYISRMPG
jgi:tetratricopeptide (TPR) repeat protein